MQAPATAIHLRQPIGVRSGKAPVSRIVNKSCDKSDKFVVAI